MTFSFLDGRHFPISTDDFVRLLAFEYWNTGMWCENCQTDVAAEVSADNKRVRCATCGRRLDTPEIDASGHQPMDERTRNARELLERWSASTSLDPYGPSWKLQTDPPPTLAHSIEASRPTELESRPDTVETSPRKTHSGSSHADTPSAHTADEDLLVDPRRSSAEPSPDQQAPRLDTFHTAPRPHLEILPVSAEEESEQSNWLTWAGQILAYVGVLGLTLGASLVLWSHFGGPTTYAPTGWLITTAAQMLLFLGVITLVSGGLEQTTHEVTRRIDRLGERMLRFEQATRDAVAPRPQTPIDTFRQEADAAARNESVVAKH